MRTMDLTAIAKEHHSFEAVDKSDFQRRARILQSLWREGLGIPPGEHHWETRGGVSRARPLGSRLPMPWAQETLANFLTDSIRKIMRTEVCSPKTSAGKLYGKLRIFSDLP